jgi:hypothetical protein
MRNLPRFFLLVDIGFLLYWLITSFKLIPLQYLYQDYSDPRLVAWNWSFFPIDMLISASGLFSLWLRRKGDPRWTRLALTSLILTMSSGLMAISYWVFAHDFSLQWWVPNLFLLFYPLFFIGRIMKKPE